MPEVALTVAVSATNWPKLLWLGLLESVVVVPREVTVWFTAAEVLVVKLLFPLYSAVSEWVPTVSVVTDKVAVPELKATVPRETLPLKNRTFPVGVPLPSGVTVAVNVTLWP